MEDFFGDPLEVGRQKRTPRPNTSLEEFDELYGIDYATEIEEGIDETPLKFRTAEHGDAAWCGSENDFSEYF